MQKEMDFTLRCIFTERTIYLSLSLAILNTDIQPFTHSVSNIPPFLSRLVEVPVCPEQLFSVLVCCVYFIDCSVVDCVSHEWPLG